MKVPCYKCQERKEGCHATCDRYRDWHGKRQQQLEQRKLDKEAVYTVLQGKKEYLDRVAVSELRRGRRLR